MCISINPAELTNTILLAHSVEHEGRIVNVIGYQNVAKNKGAGPNAMLLPFPSAAPMSQANCLDLSAHPDLFKRYAALLKPETRGRSRSFSPPDDDLAEVFESGSYTVVLASNATAIPDAISRVPEHKRPRLHPELFDAYKLWYPGWSMALCCWDGTIEAEPLLWWYEPLPEYRDRHFLPGLDGHDGKVPDPAKKDVDVDHVIVIGSHTTGSLGPTAGKVRDSVPPELRRFLPDHVYGGRLHRPMMNGDWVLPKDGWTRHNAYERIEEKRASPPGF
jgi:hypothetical protein